MSNLESLKPVVKTRVMDLLTDIGIDTSNWSVDFKGKHPSANPKYCYNWSFIKTHEFVVACLWHVELEVSGEDICRSSNLRKTLVGKGKAQWEARAKALDDHLQAAYQEALPVRVIILGGKPRDDEDDSNEASLVEARLMDEVPWAVTYYDFATGDFTVTRGANPVGDPVCDEPEYSAFEGAQRRLFVIHRRRENKLRAKKLMAAKIENGGSIKCEVPNCGFDFKAVYGAIGDGFAHVHHLLPLSDAPSTGMATTLKDLAVVCANCHAMIHVGGKNRPLGSLVSR